MNEVALIAFGLALAFIFDGEPDVWDRWHAQAMEQQECKK